MINTADTFTLLDLYNTVPKYILDELTQDVDILEDADSEFLGLVAELELETDFKKRAITAKNFIDSHSLSYLKNVSYVDLGKYLDSPEFYTKDFWRQLYVLERSIPPRFGDHFTWFDRLKVFYNTYVRERAVHGKASYNGKTLYWVKGNVKNPTNHDKLVYGHGTSGADFYFFDDNLPGDQAWQKMVKVEMKHGDADLDTEIKKHANDKFLYGAKYLILAMADGSYYMVNYNTDPATATNLNITCQDAYRI